MKPKYSNIIDNDYKKFLNKPHTIKILYSPGFSSIAKQETENILKNLWISKPFCGKLILLKKEIQIQGIYLTAITEILLRSQCLYDIHLVLYKGKVMNKKSFEKICHSINWPFYLPKNMLFHLKVESIASQLFHENAIKEILHQSIINHTTPFSSDEENYSTTRITVNIYKNTLTISLSLAGDLLYKRNYRENLNASAPLREDLAACCIHKAMQFSHRFDQAFSPHRLIIPFSGTGTLAFEYLLYHFQISSAFFKRNYAIGNMPFFKASYFKRILSKSHDHLTGSFNTINKLFIHCIDSSLTANDTLAQNTKKFNNALKIHGFPEINLQKSCEDFFDMTSTNLLGVSPDIIGNTFILLNPPYGIRLNKNLNSTKFYQKIAKKINDIAPIFKSKSYHLLGFILCPTEDAWSAFSKTLQHANSETYHFIQGGLDIRVCQFFI